MPPRKVSDAAGNSISQADSQTDSQTNSKSGRPADSKPLSFDETLSCLEELVTQMEDGKLSLEEALSTFETGIRLTRECQHALQQAELKVQILTSADAQPVPMDTDYGSAE